MAGVPAGRTLGPLGSPSWNAEYRRRVDGVTREFSAAGIATIWLGLPIPDGTGLRAQLPGRQLDLAIRRATRTRRRRGTSTRGTCSTAPHGKYTPYLRVGGKLTLMRSSDGIHFTDAAGDLIALEVMGAFRELYDLPVP